MPQVSIIVPIYNVERYLDRCMRSLLNQTLTDIEIIMVDDGSPDDCPRMCDEYAKKDERVKVIHKQNAGLGYARNSGLEIATGEYVAFVDSDDYVELSAYERMYNSVKQHYGDAVFSGFKTETTFGVWKSEEADGTESVLNNRQIYDFLLGMIANPPGDKEERSHSISVWHSLYKKEIIDKYHLRFVSEREYASEDIPFQVDFLTKCDSIVLLPFVCYYYCLNGTSLTATFKKEKFQRHIYLRNLLVEKLGNSKEVLLRIDRFFIGNVRVLMSQLMANDKIDKKDVLTSMVSHPVWDNVKITYKANYLPLQSAVMYWLTIHQATKILYLYCNIFVFLKRILKKRI